MAFFDKIKQGLSKTRKNISTQLQSMFDSFTGANEEFFEELEETLIMADLGAELAMRCVDKLRELTKQRGLRGPEELREALSEILLEILISSGEGISLNTKPSVILMIGVNGVGKTTTIGKFAARFTKEGKRALLCAGDTFRGGGRAAFRMGREVGSRYCATRGRLGSRSSRF